MIQRSENKWYVMFEDRDVLNAMQNDFENWDFSKFSRNVFCIMAKYGLQLEAKEEELLSGDEWSNPACREILIKRVGQFLIKHII